MNIRDMQEAAAALVQINGILAKLKPEAKRFALMSLTALTAKEFLPKDLKRAIEEGADNLRKPRPNNCDACDARHAVGLGPCDVHEEARKR